MTMPSRAGTSFWTRVRWLLAVLVVCRGLVDLCVLPPFEGWDEYQHVAYVEHVRQTGRAAVLWETSVSPALLAELVKFPQPAVAVKDQLRPLGGVDHATFWALHNPLDPGAPAPAPAFRGGSNALYQAQHSPMAYMLAAPLYAALGGAGNLRASVGGLRLANVGLTAAAVWLVLGGLRRVFRDERDAALAGLALAAHPLFLMNGARVANDALGVMLASACVVFCLDLMTSARERGRFGTRCLVAGLLVGLAATAKATNAGLVPFAAFAWLGAAVRGRVRVGPAVLGGVLMAAGCLAVVQSDLRFNLAHYGSLTAMQEAVINRHKGVTGADLWRSAASFRWPTSVAQLWGRDLFFTGGWSFLRGYPKATRVYGEAVAAGLLGWGFLALSRRKREWLMADDGWLIVKTALSRGILRRFFPLSHQSSVIRHPPLISHQPSVISHSTDPEQRPDRLFVSWWAPMACLVLVAGYTGALAYHMVQSKLTWGVPTTNPWYASPALPWFLALVTAGGVSWPLGRRLRPAVPLALAGAGLAAEFVTLWGRMVPAYTGGASGLEALRRLAWLQPGFLGTPTLAAAAAAEVVVLALVVVVYRDAARADVSPRGAVTPASGPAFERKREARREERSVV